MSLQSHAIQIQFVDSYKDIAPDLWARCFPATVEGLFWYETLETCGLEDQFTFLYALIKRGDEPVGIAPCFIHDLPMSLVAPPAVARLFEAASVIVPSAGYQRTLFIGSPCAEEGTIGLVPGCSLADVIDPLSQAVMARARKVKAVMVVFKDCLAEVRPAMEILCSKRDFFLVTSYPGTFIDLPGSNIDDYFASLKRSRRHNFKKKLRRSKDELDLETTYVKRPDDAECAELFGLFMQTYEKGKTKFERLSVEFFKKIREMEPAWFIFQRDKKTGKLVTFMLLFQLGDKMVNKFIGLDYSIGGNAYLYFRQFEAALLFSYERKMKELQSGQTGYRAKLDLGNNLVSLQNFCRHTNGLINKLYAYLSRDITWSTLDSDLQIFLDAHEEKAEEVSEKVAPG
jgi:hypothetical protein